jgi:hypothetical protein
MTKRMFLKRKEDNGPIPWKQKRKKYYELVVGN